MAQYKNKNSFFWKFKQIIQRIFILDFFEVAFFLIEHLFVKEKKRLLFLIWGHEIFSDNSKYLFEYLNKKNDFEVNLFVRDKKIYKELFRKYPQQTIYAFSLKGFKTFFKSKTVIISNGLDKFYFLPYYLSPRNKNIIQLWHGSLFKRLGFQVKNWEKIKSKKVFQKYSKFIACSTLERFMVSSCFDIEIDDVWVSDYPRNDYFFDTDNSLLEEHPYLNSKVILYAPTWREEGYKVKFFPFDDVDIAQIQCFLEQNDTYLLIRGHKEECERIYNNYDLPIDQTSRILPASQEIFPEGEKLLQHVNILITDYSGIYNDFLLLNRPIIFIPYDLKEYSTYRGVLLDYDKYTAGPKIFNQKDFLKEIETYLNNPKKDSELRLKLRDIFHDYSDGKACERIEDNIIKFLNEK